MRKWLVAVCTLVAASIASSSAQIPGAAPSSTGQALIMGRVIDDVSKAPLADAAVIARVAGAIVDQVRTNRDGVFVLPSVPAGEVSLGAVLPGYVGSGSAGRPVVLRAAVGARIADAVIALRRFLAIAGTVRDEAGEPVVDVGVELQLRVDRGQWSAIQSTRTDDRGVYRFAQLNAGDYRVMVSPTVAAVPHAAGAGRRMMYAATFAPAARTPQEASVVSLKPGSDRVAVDVSLAPVGEARVAGRLVAPDPGSVSRVNLRLIIQDGGGLSTPLNVATTTTDATGRFEFPRVPAGRYRLFMTPGSQSRRAASTTGAVEIATSSERLVVRSGAAAPAAAAPSQPAWVDMPVTVGDKDLIDLDVPALTGFTLAGRAVFDGATAKPEQIPLGFIRVDVPLWPMGEGRIAADGTLQASELAPGRYIVFARTGAGAWQLRSAEYHGVNIADLPVDVREPLTDIVFTFTDRQPAVSGAVRDGRGAVIPNAAVVLFPVDRRLWNVAPTSWRMKIARTTQAGEFTLRSVPAGEYFCAAIADDLSAQWNDIERLTDLAKRATTVTLTEGQPARLELQLIGSGAGDEPPAAVSGHGPFVNEDKDDQSTAPARASITGVVRDQAAGRSPLRGVAVEIQGAGENTRATTYTDAAGRFTFPTLAPGVYRITFSKPAYLRLEYGAKRIGGPGTSVVVGNTDVVLEATLARGAVITGRVSDARGRALNWTKIAVIGARDAAGQPQLFSVTTAMPKEVLTDDRGEYRVYGLAPGTYFIAATPGEGGGAFSGRPTTDADIARAKDGSIATPIRRAPVEAYAPTFHPAAREFAAAQPITVAVGEERGGVDVTMGFSPVARIRGTLVGSNGRPVAGAQLAVFPSGPYVPDADVVFADTAAGEAVSGGGSVRVAVAPSGTFAVGGLTPGRYIVFARGAARGALAEYALTTVTVDEADPPPVSLTTKPSARITGVLTTVGAAVDLSAVRIGALPVDGGQLSVSIPAVPIDADGRFSLPGALPGRYWISVTGVPTGSGIVSGLGAAGQLQAAPLVVPEDGDVADLALTLGAASSVAGTFSDAMGVPATDYLVVLFDVDRLHWLPGSPRVQAVRPRSNGEFVFADVPPGEYRLAAVTDIAPDEWRSPALLEQLVAASVAVSVKAGERTQQHLQIAK